MVRFNILLLGAAIDFLEQQNEDVRIKILRGVERSRENLDAKFFKKLKKDIWEFRTEYRGKQYRLLAFWDKNDSYTTLVIATHGFIKKVDKVPVKEIERAEQIRNKYYEKKSNQKNR